MLAESGAYQAVYLNDLTIFYLRCRFACNSLPLRNLRLLWICADLLLPAKAALLGLAAICALSIAVDYTAPKQDSRAAADNRSRGKSYSRTNGGERQQYRHAGSCIPEAKSPFEPKTANLSLSLGVPKGPFSFVKENGPFDSCSAFGAAIPAAQVPQSALYLCKIDGNRTNLCFCPHAHVGSEQADAGGDDVVHLSLLKIPAGIFPHQLDGEISREHLSIVRVATEVYVDARVRELL